MAESLRDLERRGLLLKRKLRTLGRPPTAEEAREIRKESKAIREGLAEAMIEQLILDRPQVHTSGRKSSAGAAQRGQQEARARLAPKLKSPCSNCPAATVLRAATGEVRVICGVEDTVLSSVTDPQSVLSFCMGDHLNCPSWVAEREAQMAGRRAALV